MKILKQGKKTDLKVIWFLARWGKLSHVMEDKEWPVLS